MQKIIILLCSFILFSCEQKFYISGATMGTTYSITTNTKIDKKIIDDELVRINTIFSNWIAISEVERLNNAPIHQQILISKELLKLIYASYNISQQTDNYFDITIGNLIDIWGFGVQKIDTTPTDLQIKSALENSGVKNMRITNNTIIKLKDIRFNLSAIAKGYAVDKVAEILTQNNITDFVVEIGGEVKVRGIKNIGIERAGKKPIKITLKNQAIATSGDYRNYQKFNDKKFIHILNPTTGKPANSDLISVSVIHNQAFLADAYATALLAMGSVKAIEFINKYQLKSVLIDKNNKIYKFNL